MNHPILGYYILQCSNLFCGYVKEILSTYHNYCINYKEDKILVESIKIDIQCTCDYILILSRCYYCGQWKLQRKCLYKGNISVIKTF